MLTAGELRKIIGKLPDDAPVVVQEIFSPDPFNTHEVDTVHIELRPRDLGAINGAACNHLVIGY
jgi:hypothetical protein